MKKQTTLYPLPLTVEYSLETSTPVVVQTQRAVTVSIKNLHSVSTSFSHRINVPSNPNDRESCTRKRRQTLKEVILLACLTTECQNYTRELLINIVTNNGIPSVRMRSDVCTTASVRIYTDSPRTGDLRTTSKRSGAVQSAGSALVISG